MQLTQEQLTELAQGEPFTKDTEIFEGMQIYTITRSKHDGVLFKKGLNLLAHDVILAPTDNDWDLWENTPENGNRSRYQVENPDDYWTVADMEDLDDRSLLSVEEIKNMELEVPSQNPKFFIVTYN